ncbi:universal stress protein [Aliikangiella sp. IMCC44653]
MKFPQNILVFVSGKQKEHIALTRALKFAEFYNIKLHLLSCIYDPGTELSPILSQQQKNQIKQDKIQLRTEYLNSLKTKLEAKNIPVTVEVKWERKIQQALIDSCDETMPDLVIKRISDKASSLNPFNMPIDWQLLRHCPAPLLLVKDKTWRIPAPVLAAVDGATSNPDEIAFNHEIINYAKLLSRLTDEPTHVVTTHISPQLDNAATMGGFDLESMREQVTQINHSKLLELTQDKNIQAENLHVIEGLAEERIPLLSQNINAQVVVMGTISRKGIKGAFMGNTAETVLTKLQCEVLALKP